MPKYLVVKRTKSDFVKVCLFLIAKSMSCTSSQVKEMKKTAFILIGETQFQQSNKVVVNTEMDL